jgi:hypothetical protein
MSFISSSNLSAAAPVNKADFKGDSLRLPPSTSRPLFFPIERMIMPHPCQENLRTRLRDYQIKFGLEYLRRVNGCGVLGWEMRLGKTLTVIRFLSQRKDARRILVVAPYSALEGWVDDLQKEKQLIFKAFREEPNYRETYFNNIQNMVGWFLINKECHLYLDILSYQWDAVVCDETWLANPRSKVTKYFLDNTQPKYRILLSGTLAPESELQYWSQLTWVNPEILEHRSYWDFRIRYFRPINYDWQMTLRGKQYLASRLAKYVSVLKRADVDMEKKHIYEKRIIQLSKSSSKKYHEIEMGMLDGEVLKFAGERWNEMRRICSLKEKEIELLSLLQGELKNEKTMVWCDYVEEVDRVAALLDCDCVHGGVSMLKREKAKKNFLGKGLRLVAQPQCWKWGTNLSGCDTIIFFSLPQALMTWQQVQERTVNLLSRQSLLIIILEAENTIETDIYESLREKEGRTKQLERFRRAIIQRRKNV